MSGPRDHEQRDPPILQLGCPVVYGGLLQLPADITVSRGRFECVFRRYWALWMSDRLIVHGRPEVAVVRSRVLPWPWRTSIELIGEDGETVYLALYQGVQRITAALGQAGFVVRERKVWLVPIGWPWTRR